MSDRIVKFKKSDRYNVHVEPQKKWFTGSPPRRELVKAQTEVNFLEYNTAFVY
jgi:hypothetical protein